MRRVLKPGGRPLVLESQVRKALAPLYDIYSFSVLPWLGKRVAGDEASYRYLAESIRMHPDQETLRTMMEEAGFSRVRLLQLTAASSRCTMGSGLDGSARVCPAGFGVSTPLSGRRNGPDCGVSMKRLMSRILSIGVAVVAAIAIAAPKPRRGAWAAANRSASNPAA